MSKELKLPLSLVCRESRAFGPGAIPLRGSFAVRSRFALCLGRGARQALAIVRNEFRGDAFAMASDGEFVPAIAIGLSKDLGLCHGEGEGPRSRPDCLPEDVRPGRRLMCGRYDNLIARE